jgi:hypothetical protein
MYARRGYSPSAGKRRSGRCADPALGCLWSGSVSSGRWLDSWTMGCSLQGMVVGDCFSHKLSPAGRQGRQRPNTRKRQVMRTRHLRRKRWLPRRFPAVVADGVPHGDRLGRGESCQGDGLAQQEGYGTAGAAVRQVRVPCMWRTRVLGTRTAGCRGSWASSAEGREIERVPGVGMRG